MGSGNDREAEWIASPRLLMGWRLIRANLGKLLGISATGTVFVFLWMLMQPAQYQSTVLLEVEQTGPPGDPVVHGAAAATASQIIRSRSVLELATASLALQDRPTRRDLQRGLQIEQPGHSLLRVDYRAGTPKLAQQTVNAIAQAYIQFNETQQIVAMEQSADLLLRKLDRLFSIPLWLEEGLEEGQQDLGPLVPGLDRGQTEDVVTPTAGPLLKNLRNWGPQQAIQFSGGIASVVEEAVVRAAVAGYEAGLQRITRIGVIDPADLPAQPLQKIRAEPLLATYLLLMLAVAGALLQRQRRLNSVALADEARGLLGLPVLALPETQGQEPQADPAFAEAMRTIRTLLCKDPREVESLEELSMGKKARVILVTSATVGEGKSEVAEGLALSLGQVERVLLVNTDMRSRDRRRFCHLPPETPGLSHLIAGAAQLRDCIHTLNAEGIDVIPAGILPPNPQELLASGRFRRLLDVLQRRYDFVVFAAPSLDAAADTLLLSRHCTDTLLVMRANSTPVSLVRTALQKLRTMTGPQPTVVLNRVDFRLARRYGFDQSLPALADPYVYRKPGGSYLAAQSWQD